MKWDPIRIREDFPALSRSVAGRPLAYLDNASTTQKPRAVLDAIVRFYERTCANVHRGVHTMSVEATELLEQARARVCRFINAESPEQIIFTRGTTESLNLVAQALGPTLVGANDEVLITALEHHANLVPWQQLCKRQQAKLQALPLDSSGDLELRALSRYICDRTKLIAFSQISNSLGTIVPAEALIAAARDVGAVCVVDGAQAVGHQAVDVRALDCDFYAFSGHKMFGPMGIGVLYGKRAWLERMPPWQHGGDMVLEVEFERTIFNELPYRFEAGTPNVPGAIGLAASIDYLERLDLAQVRQHEAALLEHAVSSLREIPEVRLIGTPAKRGSVVSFSVGDVHPHDAGTVLDSCGVAVRTGHHCAQPVMAHFGVPATVRASFSVYNTLEEINRMIMGIDEAVRLLA